MSAASSLCRMDVGAAIDSPVMLRHYAELAARIDGVGSVVAERLIAEEATLVLMRDPEGVTRAACHTVLDARGVTHIRGLVKVAGQGIAPRECVALAIVYQAALGHRGFTADCIEDPVGVAEWRERGGLRDAAARRIFTELGFETFAIVAGADAGSRPMARVRILNSTKATLPLARACLSSVVSIA